MIIQSIKNIYSPNLGVWLLVFIFIFLLFPILTFNDINTKSKLFIINEDIKKIEKNKRILIIKKELLEIREQRIILESKLQQLKQQYNDFPKEDNYTN